MKWNLASNIISQNNASLRETSKVISFRPNWDPKRPAGSFWSVISRTSDWNWALVYVLISSFPRKLLTATGFQLELWAVSCPLVRSVKVSIEYTSLIPVMGWKLTNTLTLEKWMCPWRRLAAVKLRRRSPKGFKIWGLVAVTEKSNIVPDPTSRIEYLVHVEPNKAIHVEFSNVLEVSIGFQGHDAPASTDLLFHSWKCSGGWIEYESSLSIEFRSVQHIRVIHFLVLNPASTIFTIFMMRLVLVRTETVAFVTYDISIVDEYDGLIEP